MITLGRLRAVNFLALQEVDIAIPEECRLLVDGANESGKSSLFAAILYALYGRFEDESQPQEAIRFGAICAEVSLSVDVAGARLHIMRSICKDGTATATLQVERQSRVEIFKGTEPVNQQIIHLFAGLDAPALLNSCFITDLPAPGISESERQEILLKLLNLNRLARLSTTVQSSEADAAQLSVARLRLNYAENHDKMAVIDGQIEKIRRLSVAARIRDRLNALRVLQGRIDAIKERSDELDARRGSYESDLANIMRLDEARRHLDAADSLAKRINERMAEIRPLDEQLTELYQTRDVAIPSCIDSLRELRELYEQLARAESSEADAIAASREIANLISLKERRTNTSNRLIAVQSAIASLDIERSRLEAMLDKLEKTVAEDLPETEQMRDDLRRLETLIGEHERLLAEKVENEAQLVASAAHLKRIDEEEATLAALTARRQEALLATQAAQERWSQIVRLSKTVQQADALKAWINARAELEAIDQIRARGRQTEEKLDDTVLKLHAVRIHADRAQTRTLLMGGITAVTLCITVILFAANIIPVALFFGLCMCVAGAGTVRNGFRMTYFHEEIQTCNAEIESTTSLIEGLKTQLEMAERRSNLSGGMAAADERVRNMEMVIPSDRQEAQQRLEALDARLSLVNLPALQLAARNPEPELGRATAEQHRLDGEIIVQRRVLADLNKGASIAAHESLEKLLQDLRQTVQNVETEIQTLSKRYAVQPDVQSVKRIVASVEERLGGFTWLLGTRPSIEESLASLVKQRAEREQAVAELEAALTTHTDSGIEEALKQAEQAQAQAQRAAQELRAAAAPILAKRKLEETSTAVREEAIRQSARLESLQAQLAALPGIELQRRSLAEALAQLEDEKQSEQTKARELVANVGIGDEDDGEARLDSRAMRMGIATAQAERNEKATRNLLHSVVATLGGINQTIRSLYAEGIKAERDIATLLNTELHISDPQFVVSEEESIDASNDAPVAGREDSQPEVLTFKLKIESLTRNTELKTLLNEVEERPVASFNDELERLNSERAALDDRCRQLQERLAASIQEANGIDAAVLAEPLDLEASKQVVARLEHEQKLKKYQQEIIALASKRMVARVLPGTERNTRLLLPLLTLGRYHDCKIEPDYRVSVWDPDAERYVQTEELSDGTQMQLQLALRLGFAMATLPDALTTTPSFLLLDEPLERSDPERSAALIRLLTEGLVASNFPQIIVTGHPYNLDIGAFTHRLTLAEGRVVFQNLNLAPETNAAMAISAA